MGVDDLGLRAGLAEEAAVELGARLLEELERDGATEAGISGAIDDAHTTLSNGDDVLVALRQGRRGRLPGRRAIADARGAREGAEIVEHRRILEAAGRERPRERW